MSEGGQLDTVASQVAVGRGYAVRCPLSLPPAVKSTSAGDAHKVCFHLFSFWLVRKAQNWRGQCVCVGGAGGTGRTHCKGMLSLPREQLPWRLPSSRQFSNHPFCSRAANDAIKFIRRTSVLNDRTTGCPLREAGLKKLNNREPGASKPALQFYRSSPN